MKLLYQTLSGENLSLDNITEEQKELLKELYQLYTTDPTWPAFANTVYSQDSIKRMGATIIFNGRYYIDTKLGRTVIYELLEDLEGILGLQQGYYSGEIDNRIVEINKRTLEAFLKDE